MEFRLENEKQQNEKWYIVNTKRYHHYGIMETLSFLFAFAVGKGVEMIKPKKERPLWWNSWLFGKGKSSTKVICKEYHLYLQHPSWKIKKTTKKQNKQKHFDHHLPQLPLKTCCWCAISSS